MNIQNLGELWQNLVVKNPMLIEIQRFRRRFLTFRGGNAMNSTVLALFGISYLGLVFIVLSGRGDIPPTAIVIFQLGVLTVFSPGVLHGAIAGERERRSWDLLLVAPLSKAQIVVGKFIGALAALGVAAALFILPIGIAATTYHATWFGTPGVRVTNWIDLFAAECLCISFVMAVCAFTLLMSARAKRPFMALGTSLGTLGILLIVLPVLIGVVGGWAPQFSDELLMLHPFYALGKIAAINSSATMSPEETFVSVHIWGWPQTFVYLALTVILIGWAINTLNFAENEVKFLPKGHHDA